MQATLLWHDGTKFRTASQRRFVLARRYNDGSVRIIQRSDNVQTLRGSRRAQLGDAIFDTVLRERV